MSQNIFAIANQEELSSLIHRPNDNCPGDCEWCSKFHKAVKAVAATSVTITLTMNTEVIVPKGHYNVWCDTCSDGENNTFYESCDWAERHAKRRHGA